MKGKLNLKPLPKLPYGEGSMHYTSEGKVRYRKSFKTFDGKSHSIDVTGENEKDARKKAKEAEKLIEKQAKTNNPLNKTLQTNMEQWILLYKKPSADSGGGSGGHTRLLSTFNTHVKGSWLGKLQEQAITTNDIQRFMNELKKHDLKGNTLKEDELSYSSKKKVYDLLNAYFNHTYQRSPHQNPMLGVLAPVKPKPVKDKTFDQFTQDNTDDEDLSPEDLLVWNDEEMDILRNAGMASYRPGIGGVKNGAAFIFAMYTYIRLGELRALRWCDIDFTTKTVRIRFNCKRYKVNDEFIKKIGSPKTKAGTRDIIMSDYAFEAIKQHKMNINPKNENEFILAGQNGFPIAGNTVEKSYKCLLRQAGLTKHVTFHGLRHSGISYALRMGAPVEVVSRQAGHSSISVTYNIYYQVIEEQKKKAMQELDEKTKVQQNN